MVHSLSKLLQHLRSKRSKRPEESAPAESEVEKDAMSKTTIFSLPTELHLEIAQYLDSSPVIASGEEGVHRISSLDCLGQVNRYWRTLSKDRSLSRTVFLTDPAGSILDETQRKDLSHTAFLKAISEPEARERFLSSRENSAARWIIPYSGYSYIATLSKEEASNLRRSYLQLFLCLRKIASWAKEEGEGDEANNQDGHQIQVLSKLTDIALVRLPYKPKPGSLHVDLNGANVSCIGAQHRVTPAVAPILDSLNGRHQDKHSSADKTFFHGTYAELLSWWSAIDIPQYSAWDALTSDALERLLEQLRRGGAMALPQRSNGDAVDVHISIDLDAFKEMTYFSSGDPMSFVSSFESMCSSHLLTMSSTRNGTSTTTFHFPKAISSDDEATLQTVFEEASRGRKHKIIMTKEPARESGYIRG